jgi:hypothetical protein
VIWKLVAHRDACEVLPLELAHNPVEEILEPPNKRTKVENRSSDCIVQPLTNEVEYLSNRLSATFENFP